MKMFYGWKMVGAAFGMQFIQASLLNQAFGAYVAVLTGEMGWSKTALSAGAAMQSVEAALLGPLLGWTVDRYGAQGMIRAGIVVFGIGFMLLSQIDTLTGFYVAIFTIAVGSSLCGYFPLTVAVVQWFEKKRARALSTMSLGLALGGIFVPLVAWSMQSFGWRATAFGSGVVAVLLGWPLARMFRRTPDEVGETVDGLPAATIATPVMAISAAEPVAPLEPADPANAVRQDDAARPESRRLRPHPRRASSPRARRCAPARSGCCRSGTGSRCSWCPRSTSTRSPT